MKYIILIVGLVSGSLSAQVGKIGFEGTEDRMIHVYKDEIIISNDEWKISTIKFHLESTWLTEQELTFELEHSHNWEELGILTDVASGEHWVSASFPSTIVEVSHGITEMDLSFFYDEDQPDSVKTWLFIANKSMDNDQIGLVVHWDELNPDDQNTSLPGEKKSLTLLRAYPNPAKDKVCLKIDESMVVNGVKLELVNIMGKVVKQEESVRVEGDQVVMDVAEIPSGLYWVKVKHSGNAEWIGKFMINR